MDMTKTSTMRGQVRNHGGSPVVLTVATEQEAVDELLKSDAINGEAELDVATGLWKVELWQNQCREIKKEV